MNYNEIVNYFAEDTFASEWFNRMVMRMRWKVFDNQEDFVYMYGELGEDENGNPRNPMFKGEDAWYRVRDAVKNEMNLIVDYITAATIIDIAFGGEVDLDDFSVEQLNEFVDLDSARGYYNGTE